MENTSGGTASSRRLHNLGLRALRAALPNQQQPDTLQQLGRRVHSLGQKNIGPAVAIVDFNFARKKNYGSLWRQALDLVDQFGSIQSGHDEIGQHQVNSTLLKSLQRVVAAGA